MPDREGADDGGEQGKRASEADTCLEVAFRCLQKVLLFMLRGPCDLWCHCWVFLQCTCPARQSLDSEEVLKADLDCHAAQHTINLRQTQLQTV